MLPNNRSGTGITAAQAAGILHPLIDVLRHHNSQNTAPYYSYDDNITHIAPEASLKVYDTSTTILYA